MKKAIAILLIIVAAFLGTLLYFHAHDTRTADSLSAYARIEFTGLRGSDGSATSAHFTVWDTRYAGATATRTARRSTCHSMTPTSPTGRARSSKPSAAYMT